MDLMNRMTYARCCGCESKNKRMVVQRSIGIGNMFDSLQLILLLLLGYLVLGDYNCSIKINLYVHGDSCLLFLAGIIGDRRK